MQEPVRYRPAVVQSRAKDPEPATIAIFYPIIVPDMFGFVVWLGSTSPPFGADPFRTAGGTYTVQRAAPAELKRRGVGHQRRYFDRLGPAEQAYRPLG